MTDDTGGASCHGDVLGHLAYDAYGEALDWTAYNGERIPEWEDQTEERRAGWRAAADAVRLRLTETTHVCAICGEADCEDAWLW